MKIFITGGSGFIGQYLSLKFSQKHEVLSQYFSNKFDIPGVRRIRLDIRDENSLKQAAEEFSPDVIIHTAAISKPAVAEKLGKEKVFAVNVEPVKTLAEISNSINAKLVFFSTDLVYDGESNRLKKETDELKPVSIYAESKVEAEKTVSRFAENYLILRIALHYGLPLFGGSNFFAEMSRNLSEGKKVRLFTDQYRTPLEVSETPELIEKLLQTNVANEIINFGGGERISRYELGMLLVETCGFDKNLIEPITTDEVKSNILVKDVSMDTSKLKSYGITIRSVSENLERICRKLKS